ncbi:MAG: class B sortase [bacterium]|nr:class B sortase [bacterium]
MKEKVIRILKKASILLVFCIGIFVLWQVEVQYGTKKADTVNAYPPIISTPNQQANTEKKNSKKEEEQQSSKSELLPAIEPFVKTNKDVIGYISIPDTNVDYPILMGQDNDYYLYHDIDGNEDKAACIMADYKYNDTNIRDKFQRHTLIYGHYLLKKTMFTSVAKYKDQKFFESHPYIYYSNLYKTGKWRVFSVYVINADQETIPRKFKEDEKYIAYLKKIKERSKYKVDVSLDKDSKILTLCTCSYETKNSRAIVHAVLVDE